MTIRPNEAWTAPDEIEEERDANIIGILEVQGVDGDRAVGVACERWISTHYGPTRSQAVNVRHAEIPSTADARSALADRLRFGYFTA